MICTSSLWVKWLYIGFLSGFLVSFASFTTDQSSELSALICIMNLTYKAIFWQDQVHIEGYFLRLVVHQTLRETEQIELFSVDSC